MIEIGNIVEYLITTQRADDYLAQTYELAEAIFDRIVNDNPSHDELDRITHELWLDKQDAMSMG